MKKIVFLLLLLTSIINSSCNKEDTTPVKDCSTGVVRFTNNGSDPYNLYVDDVFIIKISANKYQEYKVKEGVHKFYAEQASGYLLFPTTKTNSSFSVFGCQNLEWIFP